MQTERPSRDELRNLLLALDRRTLLKGSLIASVAFGLGAGLPACAPSPRATERFGRLRFFTPDEGLVLERFAGRLLPPHPPRPSVEEVGLVARIDAEIAALRDLDEGLGRDLRRLVRVIEYGPFVIGFHFGRFTRLAPEAEDRFLHDLENHRVATLRMLFRNLRALVVFFYLTDERTWESLRYAGPWISGGEARLASWRRADA